MLIIVNAVSLTYDLLSLFVGDKAVRELYSGEDTSTQPAVRRAFHSQSMVALVSF